MAGAIATSLEQYPPLYVWLRSVSMLPVQDVLFVVVLDGPTSLGLVRRRNGLEKLRQDGGAGVLEPDAARYRGPSAGNSNVAQATAALKRSP